MTEEVDPAAMALLAERALAEVRDGALVGLGSGPAASAFVRALGERVRAGLRARGVPTSHDTATLAREVGVHPVHLAQSFRSRLETTPGGFVRAHRMFRAIELIRGGASLAAAAHAAGFADQSHMTRAIRRARGAPPGMLRRLAH